VGRDSRSGALTVRAKLERWTAIAFKFRPRDADLDGTQSTTEVRPAMINQLLQAKRDEAGQTMAEYAVVLAVITVAVIGVITLLSGQITATLNSVVQVL
jgi:Flp pilus assembly pilin Flp